MGHEIGKGSYGVVKRCKHKKSGHIVAIKTYDKKNFSSLGHKNKL